MPKGVYERKRKPFMDRVISKIDTSPGNGPTGNCWLWTGAKRGVGYGVVWVKDNSFLPAHVVMWEQKNGSVPVGLELDHLCNYPACVNPTHLEAVSHLKNVRRFYRSQYPPDMCVNGHLFEGSNIYLKIKINGSKIRECRECRRLSRNRYELKQKVKSGEVE